MVTLPLTPGEQNWNTDIEAWLETQHNADGTHNLPPAALGSGTPDASTFLRGDLTWQKVTASQGLYPVSVGPWPQDDSGWTRDLIGTGDPKRGISQAPTLTLMAAANKLHLPASVAALSESPPTTLQAQHDATSSGGVCQVLQGYIYREAVTVTKPITFVCHGNASLRGTDDWSTGGLSGNTWTAGSGIWTSSLTIPAMALDGLQGSPTDSFAQQHRETVYSDGLPLRIINSATPTTGRWALDGSRHVILGDNPSGHKIEVTTRSTVMTSTGNNAFILDGLDIRQVASSGTGQPTAIDLSSITSATIGLLNLFIGWCHGAGLNVGGKTKLFYENVIVHDCGIAGITGSSNTNPLYSRVLTFNNGASVFGFDPFYSSGGIKEAGSSGVDFDRCVAFANRGAGLWMDIQCTRGVWRDSVCWDNPLGGNIVSEISSFSVIRDNVVFRTPNQPGGITSADIGIQTNNSRWIDIHNNLVMHLPRGVRNYWAPSRTDSPPNGTTDNTHMGGVTIHGNSIIGRYNPTDQSGQDDVAIQLSDDGTGTYTTAVTSNTGGVLPGTSTADGDVYGWPALVNSGGSFLEVQQEPRSRWWYDANPLVQVTTIATWRSNNGGRLGQNSRYMLEGERVSNLLRFGLVA